MQFLEMSDLLFALSFMKIMHDEHMPTFEDAFKTKNNRCNNWPIITMSILQGFILVYYLFASLINKVIDKKHTRANLLHDGDIAIMVLAS